MNQHPTFDGFLQELQADLSMTSPQVTLTRINDGTAYGGTLMFSAEAARTLAVELLSVQAIEALAAISGAHGPSTGSTARQLSEAALAADVTGKAQGMVTQLHHRFPRLYGLLRSRYGEAAPLDHAPIVMYEVQRYLEDQAIVLAHCQAAARTLGRGVAFSTKLDDANLDGTFHHLVRTHGPAFDKRGVFAVTYGLIPEGDFAVIALRGVRRHSSASDGPLAREPGAFRSPGPRANRGQPRHAAGEGDSSGVQG